MNSAEICSENIFAIIRENRKIPRTIIPTIGKIASNIFALVYVNPIAAILPVTFAVELNRPPKMGYY